MTPAAASGDIPEHWRRRGSSAFADSRFDPRAQRLGRANLVKQPPCEAVLRLTRHRKEHVLSSHDGMTPHGRKLVGFAQEFLDLSGESSHGRIMTQRSGDIPEHWRSRRVIRRRATVLSS
jgi:hypothetical protein